MNNPVKMLFEALEASDLAEKEALKKKTTSCIDVLERYFQIVIREEMFYSSRPVEELNITMVKTYDSRRRSAHDDCICACARLNEICMTLNIDKICNVDVEDRTQVAQFCGCFISSLYFSNIRCNEDLTKWLESCPLNQQT